MGTTGIASAKLALAKKSKGLPPRHLGLMAKKVGMTRIFTEDGKSIPTTVLDVSSNRISQIRKPEVDGYSAIQIAFGSRKAKNITKSVSGHLAKAGAEAAAKIVEFRVNELGEYKVGDKLGVQLFNVGQKVDVSGQSIGKGFAGVIKRHNFHSNRATHGNSVTTRAPGSIGMRQDPGRVFKNKRMAGHLGDVRVSVQNLEVIRIDETRNLLWLKGAIPGFDGALVTVKQAIKAKAKKA